jgi:hypothetical protein
LAERGQRGRKSGALGGETLSNDMSLLKQIEDKGAVLEWSPVAEYASLVALGTKVGAI